MNTPRLGTPLGVADDVLCARRLLFLAAASAATLSAHASRLRTEPFRLLDLLVHIKPTRHAAVSTSLYKRAICSAHLDFISYCLCCCSRDERRNGRYTPYRLVEGIIGMLSLSLFFSHKPTNAIQARLRAQVCEQQQ